MTGYISAKLFRGAEIKATSNSRIINANPHKNIIYWRALIINVKYPFCASVIIYVNKWSIWFYIGLSPQKINDSY